MQKNLMELYMFHQMWGVKTRLIAAGFERLEDLGGGLRASTM